MGNTGLIFDLFDELLIVNIPFVILLVWAWKKTSGDGPRDDGGHQWTEMQWKLGALVLMAVMWSEASLLAEHFPRFARRLSMLIF